MRQLAWVGPREICNRQTLVLGVPPIAMNQRLAKSGHVPGTLILPVETLSREFDAKLHLALRAVARGWRVIIGGRTEIHSKLPLMPRSVYLSKGIRTGNRRVLRLIEQLGHVIVSLDEESLIRQSDEALLMMLDEETFNRPRILYAWGRSNADVWRSFKGYRASQPILEAGNPRVDLLRPELAAFYASDADALRVRYGRFVLVSSNFSLVNHFIKGHVRFRTAKGGDNQRGEELKAGLVAHKRQLFEAFRAMIPGLARAVASASLIIRPHPSEDPQIWISAAAGLDNVHVVHEGPLPPWIMAAEALIHNGCTSAVEAAILGTRAFAFKPFISEEYDVELPDGLSQTCHTVDDLFAAVRETLHGEKSLGNILDASQQALLRQHIASVDGQLSCDRILDSLENNPAMHANLRRPGLLTRLLGLTNHYKRRVSRAIATKRPGSPSSASYTAHKFPGITAAMIDTRIERLRALVPGLPPVRHRVLASQIFVLEGVTGDGQNPGDDAKWAPKD